MNTSKPTKPSMPLIPAGPAGGSLSGNKPWLEKNIEYELSNAYAEAQMEHMKYMCKSATGDDLTVNTDMQNSIYAFSNKFAELLAPKLAKMIYDYVKNMAVTISPKGTLTTPVGGPVSGAATSGTGEIEIS